VSNWPALLGIFSAVVLGAISPGPSFVLVARTAMTASRREALVTALGMGTGAFLLAEAAALGLQALMLAFPWLYGALRLLGSLYLGYLGVSIWRASRKSLIVTDRETDQAKRTGVRAFTLALLTQLSNPATAIALASIFAAFMPERMSPLFALSAGLVVFMVDAGWYTIVALALSSDGPRTAYLRHQGPIDRAVGALIVILAARLSLAVFF
jgi:threonine/homoserine/homoserine lactone efflux protein